MRLCIAFIQMNEDPRLYAIAKRITLEAGFDYTDPRTGVTTKSPWRQAIERQKKRAKKRRKKKLKKVLARK